MKHQRSAMSRTVQTLKYSKAKKSVGTERFISHKVGKTLFELYFGIDPRRKNGISSEMAIQMPNDETL